MRKLLILFSFMLLILHLRAQSRRQLRLIKHTLEQVNNNDQYPRHHLDSLTKQFGSNSAETTKFWISLNKQDSLNRIIIRKILDKYGWLSAEKTSKKANSALFIVLQHADLKMQQKYLPMLAGAVKRGDATKSEFAFLTDRIKMSSGKYQIYGTQIGGDYKGNLMVWPIADAPHVNQRRASMGLEKIEEYIKFDSLTYVIPKVDSLFNKVIINGYLTDDKRQAIDSVMVHMAGKRLLAQTDKDGIFRIIIDRRNIRLPLVFKCKGFSDYKYWIKDEGEDVFFINATLRKKTSYPFNRPPLLMLLHINSLSNKSNGETYIIAKKSGHAELVSAPHHKILSRSCWCCHQQVAYC